MTPVRLLLLVTALAIALMVSSSAPRGQSSTITLLTWNVEHGGPRGVHSQVRFLNALPTRPDVIVLQEVNDEYVSTYARGIDARRGESWHAYAAPHCQVWIGASPSGACESARAENVLILTTLSVLGEGRTWLYGPDDYMDARAAAFVTAQVNGLPLLFAGTHLAAGQTGDMDGVRASQVRQLIDWLPRAGDGARVIGGDFNVRAEQQPRPLPYQLLNARYADAWALAAADRSEASSHTFSADPTKGALDRRLDAWFIDGTGVRLQSLTRVSFPDSRALSDHFPLQATVVVDPASRVTPPTMAAGAQTLAALPTR